MFKQQLTTVTVTVLRLVHGLRLRMDLTIGTVGLSGFSFLNFGVSPCFLNFDAFSGASAEHTRDEYFKVKNTFYSASA